MTVEEATGWIYTRVSTAAWDRSGWWYEGPQFLYWYWDVRPHLLEEINR